MEEKIYERQISKLSLSERVVDERQIERHYTAGGLSALYEFKPDTSTERATPILPKVGCLCNKLLYCGQMY